MIEFASCLCLALWILKERECYRDPVSRIALLFKVDPTVLSEFRTDRIRLTEKRTNKQRNQLKRANEMQQLPHRGCCTTCLGIHGTPRGSTPS
jgi:hypothetical protein